jgi:hypothetical protein
VEVAGYLIGSADAPGLFERLRVARNPRGQGSLLDRCLVVMRDCVRVDDVDSELDRDLNSGRVEIPGVSPVVGVPDSSPA